MDIMRGMDIMRDMDIMRGMGIMRGMDIMRDMDIMKVCMVAVSMPPVKCGLVSHNLTPSCQKVN